MKQPCTRAAARHLPLLRKTALALAVAASFSAPLPAAAVVPASQRVPLGSEFLVNTTTFRNQAAPGVALDSAGDFVVVWQGNYQDYGTSAGIFAQRYNANGSKPAVNGSEFQVNSFSFNDQTRPVVAMDAAGDFVVAWESYNQDAGNYGIFAQRYNSAGNAVGTEFQVNTIGNAVQKAPAIAMDAAGDFVIAWQSNAQEGAGTYGVYAQRYDSAGSAVGTEFRVNTTTVLRQMFPRVAMDAAGDFVVAWQSDAQDGDGTGIFAQRFDSTGTAQGAEFPVNSYTTSVQALAGVAMDAAGDFVVTWQSYQQDYIGSFGIHAQRYNADGSIPGTNGAEFRVNTTTSQQKRFANVAMDASGEFVVTWQSNAQDGDNYGVYAQKYDSSGFRSGSEFRVNTTTVSAQISPAVAMDGSGDFVVAWKSYGDGDQFGVYAQRYGLPPVDLSLALTASPNPVNTAALLTYSLAVTNNSATEPASGVSAHLTLSPELSYSGTFSGAGWSCGGTVTCTLSGILAAGATSTVTVSTATGSNAGVVKSFADVSATTNDDITGNNHDSVTALICDAAGTDSIGFSGKTYSATEGASATITVIRTGVSCSDATVHYATVAGGTAPAGDFTATSGDFTWTAAEANKKTFTVPLINNANYSGNRTVNLALSSPSSNATLSRAAAVLTIKDDEVPLTISLSTSDQTVSEEGGVATVTATLSTTRTQSTTVPLAITGNASKTKDYTLSAASITIPANQLSGSVTLTGLHDVLDEPDETATVKVNPVSGIAASGTTTNVITFTDDDATPTISFDAAASTKPENKANVVTLVLSAVSGQDVVVNVSSTGGSASGGSDYTINNLGTIIIPAGNATATAVHIIDDATHESSETATFQINFATHAVPAGIQSTTLTITDNDP